MHIKYLLFIIWLIVVAAVMVIFISYQETVGWVYLMSSEASEASNMTRTSLGSDIFTNNCMVTVWY